MSDEGGNIKVVVRCRPLNSRELARGAKPLIRMQGNQTLLDPPEAGSQQAQASAGRSTEKKTIPFTFDKSYWSAGPRDEPNYCSQQTLFDDLGKELLDHSFSGFNACILAYGQTGSGKSYSMMGYGPDKGIIPLTCNELFTRCEDKKSADVNISFTVEVSYIEIYNEKVKDLLNPKNTGNMKVREHPSLGPYVEDLSKLVVNNYDEMMTLMDEGNKARTVAATNMNETSSRSHAVFTLLLTMKRHDPDTNLDTEKVSRINLVDLAGSERANSTGATGQRLKEGANINKSLTTLGKVISSLALASQSDPKSKKKKDGEFVPYRDSVLTWLLKDSLGGNSKTAMIAAISPADYDETLSTLRYADQAKKIKNKAVVNEDPNAKLVRELKEELEMLRARVTGVSAEEIYDPKIPAEKQKVTYQAKDGTLKTVTKAELQEQMEQSEKLMQGLNETWEDKLQRTQEVHKAREKVLEDLGISVEKNNVGVYTPRKMPHLVNLNEDPLMTECLIYQIKPGRTLVTCNDRTDDQQSIRLHGDSMLDEHCVFENADGKCTVTALPDSVCIVNGQRIEIGQPRRLRSGYRIVLGVHHTFRFNNPEEARKKLDRATAKSSLHISTLAADVEAGTESPVRPDSPASSEDEQEVDWTKARLEAQLALQLVQKNSDLKDPGQTNPLDAALEGAPSEDLGRIRDRIDKIFTVRGHANKSRPGSSLSVTHDDFWSESGRPVPSDVTDDTSVDLAPSHGSPELEAAHNQVEKRLRVISESMSGEASAEAEDLKAEKEHMERQMRMMRAQMKRIVDARARGEDVTDLETPEPVIYTAKQLRVIRRALDKWRAHRSFSMAESVLSNAVVIKEANIICKELGKNLTYNFTIASGGALAAPVSAVETIIGHTDFGDVSDAPMKSTTQPSVAVKVLDKQHNAIYLWSLDRLQQQLQRMRNLTAFIDRPTYSHHFSSEDPFRDRDPPEFSFIGNALIALAPLTRQLSMPAVVPIFCRYTAEAIGSCRVDLKVISVTASGKRTGTSSRPSSPTMPTLSTGSKVKLLLAVDQVKGLSRHEMSAVHVQARLSSFVGPTLDPQNEGVFTSTVVDIDKNSLGDLKYRREFTIAVTSKVLTHLRTGYAPIEVFASLKPTYLERMERWDEMREQKNVLPLTRSPSPTIPQPETRPPPPTLPPMRRSETDFVVEQVHDVIVWLQICELAPDGQYMPVPVVVQGDLDPGACSLHQGLQRRVVLTLVSTSGRQLPWTDITRVRLGNVRLLDAKGRVHDSEAKSLVSLPLLQHQTVEFKPDGTGKLIATALWDSSVHDSVLLNRVTAAGQRILLQATWSTAVQTCSEPVEFSMDVAVTMQTRDARPPSRFLSFLGSTKVLPKTSHVFNVRLTPPLTRSPKDLWRLDTAEKYVRGEESLGTWKPRGISVVEDYSRLVKMEERAADVQVIRAVLTAHPPRPAPMGRDVWGTEDILKKSVEMWQRQFGHRGQIVLSQDPSDDAPSIPSSRSSDTDSLDTLKLISTTKLVPRSDVPAKKGHLMVLTDASQNVWEKRWFVLRRPYLHMFKHSNELEEVGIASLSGVNVESNPEMETLFGKRFCFTLFTSSNSYALAAPNIKELQQWTTKLDPTRSLS